MCWSDDRRRRCVMSACTQEMLWCHKNRAGLRWGSFFFKTRFCIILVKCWMIYINMFHLKKRRLWFKRSDWWMWEKQTNHWTKLKMKVFCVCFYHFYANKSSTKAFILPFRWRFLLMQINVDLSSCCCLFICWFECFFFLDFSEKLFDSLLMKFTLSKSSRTHLDFTVPMSFSGAAQLDGAEHKDVLCFFCFL